MINTTVRNEAILVVVDVQERMMRVIQDAERVIDNVTRLIRGCRELGVPIIVTEQYPRGLGPTVPQVREALGEAYRPIEKLSFSAAADMEFMQAFEGAGRHKPLICGVEGHVCVYQTVRDLYNLGFRVEVVADAVGSRVERNYQIGLERLTRHGVDVTSTEMALFDMLVTAEAAEFKAISAIVK